ncbi:unnamed protein product [Allacma fusca]|uniref:Tetraspanin n=1 Tax=Allacma fusca TaxID=39272 RepID=A0A8J2JUP0_9HEXA|nr:unnamed protein product [Allacma fusca]
MAGEVQIRIIFSCLMLPALIGSAVIGYFYRAACSDLMDVAGLQNHLILTLYVIEGFLWLDAAIALICILLFMCRKDDCPVTIAFQSCLVGLAVGMACWTFYSEGIRYRANAKNFRFTIYENWTAKGVLEEDAVIMERRRYDYENFQFLDTLQAAYSCCGLVNYTSYNDNVTQEWLHVNLTDSCKSKGLDDPEPTPEYCLPIFKEGQEIPKSCCKSKGCNTTDVFHTNFNRSTINTEPGCTRKILPPINKCSEIFPFVMAVAFFLAVYTPLIAYGHARKVQGTSFWNKFCCYCLWAKNSSDRHRQSIDEFSRMVMQLSRRHMSKKMRNSSNKSSK